ncbi:MAG: hypothetical protein A2176_05675 [Spirochaetes bacterium RBG_13_51_14]|nr:MAG: hypothetical protein A2176_05675 [Spirochaetes bacterium RBG_13_51_14]
MLEGLRDFLNVVKAIAIFLGLGAIVSFIYYNLRKRDLFGGYLLDRLFYNISVVILEFLSRGIGVNVIAGFIGAYAALYIMNRLNHNRERKKY